jgi:outer membrane protein TolC
VSQTRASLLVLFLAAVLGWTVGPTYQRPDLAVPQQWAHADQPGLSAGVITVLQWWHTFQDPMLDALIERAVRTNLDLRMAAARVREARALRGVAAADHCPTVTVSGAYARNRLSENLTTTPKSIAPEYDLFQSGFDASWELDLCGRVRRTVEAASADLAATEDTRRDVLVTLLAEVAHNYVDVCGFQRRLDITRAYSQNIRTHLPAGGYAPTIAHTSACLPPYDHGYSPAIWTTKVAGEREWTGHTYWRISLEPSIRNCCS